jgi:hypothetical protein
MTATTKKTNVKLSDTDDIDSMLCSPDRDAKIAECAYYKAKKRDFALGYEFEDWLEAERELSL